MSAEQEELVSRGRTDYVDSAVSLDDIRFKRIFVGLYRGKRFKHCRILLLKKFSWSRPKLMLG